MTPQRGDPAPSPPVSEPDILYRVNPVVTSVDLNELFARSWPDHECRDFTPELVRSLAFVCAYAGEDLVGFVKLAWDGGIHAFLLDTTVHPALRRRGIGRQLVKYAVSVARDNGIRWVHVDFEPRLREFYRGCGFEPTEAGLIRLTE